MSGHSVGALLTALLVGIIVQTVDSTGILNKQSRNFNYDKKDLHMGPHGWSSNYPMCREYSNNEVTENSIGQSPVELWSGLAWDWTKDLQPPYFDHFDELPADPNTFFIYNNGHGVQINLTGIYQENTTVTLDNYAVYKLLQIDFHWAQDDYSSSEHSIDGVRYAMELHFVFEAVGAVLSQDEDHQYAFDVPDNVPKTLIIAVMGDLKMPNDVRLESVTTMGMIVGYLQAVNKPTFSEKLPNFRLDYLLPPITQRRSFYRYDGSLTAPPCTTNVTWLVFNTGIPVTREHVHAFRNSIYDTSKKIMQSNIRPTQTYVSALKSHIDEMVFPPDDPRTLTKMNATPPLLSFGAAFLLVFCAAAAATSLQDDAHTAAALMSLWKAN